MILSFVGMEISCVWYWDVTLPVSPPASLDSSLQPQKDAPMSASFRDRQPKKLPMIYVFFFFLRLHLPHMEVPVLGVESDLQLLATATATATQDLSHICDLMLQLAATPDP